MWVVAYWHFVVVLDIAFSRFGLWVFLGGFCLWWLI